MLFPIVFRVEISRRKKLKGCAQDDWSATTKGEAIKCNRSYNSLFLTDLEFSKFV